MLASHKHSDHLDPGTLPDLLAASPGAILVVARIDPSTTRVQLGLPRDRLVGLDAGDTLERAGFRVRAVPSAHEGLDTDPTRASSLPGVRDRVRGAEALS